MAGLLDLLHIAPDHPAAGAQLKIDDCRLVRQGEEVLQLGRLAQRVAKALGDGHAGERAGNLRGDLGVLERQRAVLIADHPDLAQGSFAGFQW